MAEPSQLEVGIGITMLAGGLTEVTINESHEAELVKHRLVKKTQENGDVTLRLEEEA